MVNYKVEQNTEVGRYAIASKNLSPGEEVLSETPFIIGPKAVSIPVCLGCYTPVVSDQLCDKCQWPTCSQSCSEMPEHRAYECEVFSKAKIKYTPPSEEYGVAPCFQCLTILRCLLQMEKDPGRWEKEIMGMSSHCESRKGTEIWMAEEVNVVKFLHTSDELAQRFPADLVHRVCGILEVNSFEALTPEGYAIQGLYPQAAIMSHNCIANTTHTIYSMDNFRISVRTTVPVEEGQELFSSYTGSLQPTLQRRAALKETKYFWCKCPRCSDPTELGCQMSSLKCTKCDPGLIISSDPLDENAPWKCTHCDFGVTGNGIRKIYLTIQQDIDNLEGMEFSAERLQQTEQLFKKLKSVLHPRHAFNISICHSLLQMYGKVEGYTLDMLPDILLEHKSELCSKVMSVLDIIEPGLTRIRGLILYEWHAVEMLYARSRFEYKVLTLDKFKEKILDVIRMLEESVKILSLEPDASPEGSLALTSQVSLEQLKQSVDKITNIHQEQE